MCLGLFRFFMRQYVDAESHGTRIPDFSYLWRMQKCILHAAMHESAACRKSTGFEIGMKALNPSEVSLTADMGRSAEHDF